ncbi:MAG: hypothetical protein AB7F96_16550 [Beijerinckiaceae bacterium]
MFNRKVLYGHLRDTVFGGKLSVSQVQGLDNLLDIWEQDYADQPNVFLAYALATAAHETKYAMQPVIEAYWVKSKRAREAYYHRMYDIKGERPKVARVLGNTHPGDGVKFPGMGLAQTTGRSNFGKVGRLIAARTGEQVDLLKNPKLLLKPKYAGLALFEAMLAGIYTSRKLADYMNGDTFDAYHARQIINRMDKARQIAGIHNNILAGLELAAHAEAVVDETEPETFVDSEYADYIEEGKLTTGKPMAGSKTIKATAAAGGIMAALEGPEIFDKAEKAVTLASKAKGLADQAAAIEALKAAIVPCLLIVAIGCLFFIAYDRWKKSHVEGV